MQYCVLYNPAAGNNRGEAGARRLQAMLAPDEVRMISTDVVADYDVFFAGLAEEEIFVLVGGDGTLNRFLNDSEGKRRGHSVWYYPGGSGNDFWKDIGRTPEDGPCCIDEYIRDLPTVTVNGMTRRFINGIGYGIDGYCCEEGDRRRQKDPKAKINYTAIAVKGLVYAFHPANATVTADGTTYTYPKAWLAPTMIGRYFGGGMMATPDQNRLNPEHTVSCMVMNGVGKLKTLLLFPTIFKGGHVKHTDLVHVHRAQQMRVAFDRPCALQIDGETVLNVTEYSVDYRRKE